MPFRKPAVVFTPKSLLRHPLARSPAEDFLAGTSFKRIIPDESEAIKKSVNVQRLVFCTGKVYYDLVAARKHVKKEDAVSICRVEQISPFPYDLIQEQARKNPGAEIIWVQEVGLYIQKTYANYKQNFRKARTWELGRSCNPDLIPCYLETADRLNMLDVCLLRRPPLVTSTLTCR